MARVAVQHRKPHEQRLQGLARERVFARRVFPSAVLYRVRQATLLSVGKSNGNACLDEGEFGFQFKSSSDSFSYKRRRRMPRIRAASALFPCASPSAALTS